ncbi:hypothetical protein K502DRAFT_349316 [Neoconidiobolus thromboides FSU 785]|nr:hypothetical protein K502DRAFT_349316 [Neoconidiobolus thromboides FSU 785]
MYLVNKDDPDNNLIAVQILGTLEMIWPFLTTILSSSLAIVRLTVTLNIKHPKYLILIPIACFLIYTSSYITLAVKTEIRLSPYGFLAHAYPNISSLSTFAFYCLPFCLIIGAILINYCYIKILYITRGSRDFNHFATFDSQLNKRATLFNQTNTSFRLWSIIFIHTITVFPAAIIFIIDGYYTANEPTTYSSAIVLGYFKVLLIVTASLSNSLFVLFNHPLIFTQLKTLCNID